MTDTKQPAPAPKKKQYGDTGEFLANIALSTALIGTLTTCSGEMPEDKVTQNKEAPTKASIIGNSAAAAGGGVGAAVILKTGAAANEWRKRRKEQKLQQAETSLSF